MESISQKEVKIVESYRNWKPSINAGKTVRKLINVIPAQYLVGLHSIVLTNSSGLNHQRRHDTTKSRGKKVALSSTLGLYHRAFRGQLASIELFVDNIVNSTSTIALWIPLFRDIAFGSVVYHELGHHLHATQAPEYREREDVADKWERKLSSYYYYKHVNYLVPIAWLWWKCLKPLLGRVKKNIFARLTRASSRRNKPR